MDRPNTTTDVFDSAVDAVLAHEGGYVNHPDDPGGETNFGISKRSYPHLDIRHLTSDRAREIYRSDYWERIRCGEIESPLLAAKVFDAAVNIGTYPAARCLQRSVNRMGAGLKVDGLIGARTLAAVNGVQAGPVLVLFVGELVRRYLDVVERNPAQRVFLKGWLHRAVSVPLGVL